MTPYETRMLELLDRLETTLGELRLHFSARPPTSESQALEAFADEALRDRDA